ncbi:MAG TPA: hypothetical protein HPQ04_06395 [Rhodospirillaceae bacterium]|nr:hypothetical protein [Rhodospirillaceae bacterium]
MRHPFLVFFLLVLMLGTSGCASVSVAPVLPKVGKSVEFGVKHTVDVGESVFSEFDYASAPGAVLRDNCDQWGAMQHFKVPAGASLLNSTVSGKPAFCTPGPAVFAAAGNPIGHACFFDETGSGVFASVTSPESALGIVSDITPLRYSKTEIIAGQGFKYDLLYDGINNNTIHLSYREYQNNFVRPAFQQDIQYTINTTGDTEVSFKGARILVHNANNNNITYTVFSGVRR